MAQNGPASTNRDRAPVAYLLLAGFVASGVLLGVWIALVGQADLQDNIAGLVAAGVALVFAWLVSVRGRAVPQFRRADLVRIAAFAPQTFTQTAGVYLATWRRVRGRGQPSGVRDVATEVGGGGGWPSARRSGVVAALLSFTPNTIVIDINAETGVATVHDFVAKTGPGRA